MEIKKRVGQEDQNIANRIQQEENRSSFCANEIKKKTNKESLTDFMVIKFLKIIIKLQNLRNKHEYQAIYPSPKFVSVYKEQDRKKK